MPICIRVRTLERMFLATVVVLTIVFWIKIFKMAFEEEASSTDFVSGDYTATVSEDTSQMIKEVPCAHPDALLLAAVEKIKKVITDMQTHTNGYDKHFLLPFEEQLESFVQSLDSSYVPKSHEKIESNPTKDVEFCPQKFTNITKEEDYYYINGSWITEECPNLLPLQDLVSIILYANENIQEKDDAEENCSTTHNRLLKMIQGTHPGLKVYIALHPSKCKIKELPNVKVIGINPSLKAGDVWHNLVLKVTTPYVLVGRNLDYFSWHTQIRRQLSIIASDTRVKVVGGSFRNLTGHWQTGCYQTSLFNYILKYTDGYHASKNECMFCDHLLGPFVTKTALIRKIRLHENLTHPVVFEDWFLRLKKKGYLVMSCPDAMYFSTDPDIAEKATQPEIWFDLTKIWQINRLVLPGNVVMGFACEDSGLECPYYNSMAGKKMLPICCMDQFANAMEVFQNLCESKKFLYSYYGVFVLGAVKLKGIIPWNFDCDSEIYSKDEAFFYEWGDRQINLEEDVYIEKIDHGLSLLWSPDMFMSLWPMARTASDEVMPEVFTKIPTRIKIHGLWVYGPPSPGLHARNMYGEELLKHTDKWYHTGKWSWKEQENSNGHFERCEERSHHACPINFFTDGSLQFEIP